MLKSARQMLRNSSFYGFGAAFWVLERVITSCSASPELSSSHQDDEKHIYTNIREMDELNNRPFPPVPDVTDVPRRNLNNGWMEYETEAGRTYFYNFETGKSQWIPPRFIRTPAQVQAILQATRTEVDENFSTTSSKHEDSHSTGDESSLDVSSSSRTAQSDEVVLTESTTSSEKKPAHEHTEQDFKNSPPVSTYHHAASSSDDTTMMSSFHAHVGPDPLGLSLKQNSTRNHVNQAPATERSQSFNKRKCSLKNVPLPQVLPSTSSGNLFYGDSGTHSLDRVYPKPEKEPIIYDTPCDRRERLESSGSVEVRESVKTIKCGNLELVESAEQIKSRKRDWMVNFMYLTSAHLILYKDEKSAEKHGNHYAAPRGVCDLKGASVSWLVVEKEKRKRKIIQLELSNGCRYLFRSTNDVETNEWFDALRDVIARLVGTLSFFSLFCFTWNLLLS
ncbi:PH domain protein [Ancylostoma duodenale]|uniref:PH domain protein n=1 Tax=Ancylostoma duodenale TaxID=51022 RepID=A0A0C2CMD9_9BILA|nr:PH domain protein [Ancylostoma duodenale]